MNDRCSSSGFTLIEVVIVVFIVGIITVPLSNVVITFLRNSDATNAQLSESRDAQITTAYWSQDVASIGTRSATSPYTFSQSVETGVAYNAGLYPCGVAGTPNAIVRMAWDDYATPSTASIVRVSYVVITTSGRTELHRLRCQGSATPVSDITLARDINPLILPTVTCATTCTAAPALPASVTLTLSIKDPKNTGNPYSLTFTGQRRQTS